MKQRFEAPVVDNLPEAIGAELDRIDAASIVGKGSSVAVTAGSRGVADIAVIVKAAVDYLKRIGAEPFIVPAMGSHGGATAEGQREVLAHYGITDESMGVPIKATMDVVEIGQTADRLPVFLDRYASEADHIIPSIVLKPILTSAVLLKAA